MSGAEIMKERAARSSEPSSLRSSSAPSAWASWRALAGDIKLHHSVFALPFAVLGAFMAAAPADGAIEGRRFGLQLALVVPAMVLARSAAMFANRLLDRELDARNPRTAGRAIPSGRATAPGASLLLALCAAIFLLVCAGFGVVFSNWWPLALGLPVLAWICLYPLAKRFTALCHVWLGASLALSPLAAAIAVDPSALAAQPSLWLLAVMVLCWVAGFDIIYALQDVEVDRAQNLNSMPANLGAATALWVSRGLHAAAVGCLLGIVVVDDRMGPVFACAAGLVVPLLVAEHLTIARRDTTRMALAFFSLNGLISCLLGAAGIVDVLVL